MPVKRKRLILASKSPRRIALLKQIGLEFDIIPSSTDESFDLSLTPEANARRLALEKATNVGAQIDEGIVIGADTIVLLDGELLAKPIDAKDAIRMLQKLSGRTHIVITGFALLDRPGNRSVSDAEMTRVTFRSLSPEEIERYVAGGSPFDKAGGYGIQDDYGAVFVSRIEGCFYNVVGFPLSKFHETLGKFCALVQRN
jgi:septum formation protein